MGVAICGPPWFGFFLVDSVSWFGHFEEAVAVFDEGVAEQVVGFLWVVYVDKSFIVEIGHYCSVPFVPVVVIHNPFGGGDDWILGVSLVLVMTDR